MFSFLSNKFFFIDGDQIIFSAHFRFVFINYCPSRGNWGIKHAIFKMVYNQEDRTFILVNNEFANAMAWLITKSLSTGWVNNLKQEVIRSVQDPT